VLSLPEYGSRAGFRYVVRHYKLDVGQSPKKKIMLVCYIHTIVRALWIEFIIWYVLMPWACILYGMLLILFGLIEDSSFNRQTVEFRWD
jgi:hypothetical protein